MNENNAPTKDDSAPPLDEHFRAGLALLWRTNIYAHDTGVDVWEFALEIEMLYESGMTVSDLRWLVSKGYANHAQETSVYGDVHRSFRPGAGLNFTDTTCFVLTENGAEFVNKVLKEPATN